MKETLLVAAGLPRSVHLSAEGGILLEMAVTLDVTWGCEPPQVFLGGTLVLFEFGIPLGIICSFLGVISVPERAANISSLQSQATRSSRIPCPSLCVVFL